MLIPKLFEIFGVGELLLGTSPGEGDGNALDIRGVGRRRIEKWT